jgi:signal transduction histidine kinase
VLTSADLFRFAFAAVVALGGILKLHHIASEREALLATEKETNRHLGELAVMKADFTAMIAHELNSPLSAIRGLTDMLSTDNLTLEERKHVLEKIPSETDALNALVEDVRTVGTVERDDFNVELRPVPLKMLLDDAAAFFRTLPGDHPLVIEVGVELVEEREERVWADAGRIGQVLRNLLSNAAKYSPEGAPVELRAMLETGDRAERVRMEVADSGRGIHPADVARIFEKFGRGRDASGRKVPGVGLGLYLSRRIIRCHGGDLTVRSTSGAGSVFAFELEAVR